MRSRSRQAAWLQKALCFLLVSGVVTAAGAGGEWSNVRSLTFTSNAADPTGTPPDLIHVSSFEAGEMPGPVFCDGAFVDRDGDGLRDLACVTEFVPADPVSVAPPLDPTVPANYHDATIFIYEGVDPIQRGVRPGTIVDYRATVMRGLVRDNQGQPLPGVLVRILDHPELGYTYTRGDGMFDMAVNGGGDIVVHYSKDGYLRAQRRIDTPWNDWRWVDDATLIPLDTAMTVVPTTGMQGAVVARATTVTDADGSRRATAFFPAGTQAWLRFANGATQAAPQLSFRATEYTVGGNGPERMPGNLPPSTAYTYAVELSADEAIAAGAQSVEFSQPVAMYLENFLRFPVGTEVPVGSYSFRQASWNPEDNGRVIKILSTAGGIATIDIDGSGNPANDTALLELGITSAERASLAATYASGTQLWRYRVLHFTPWDCNFPFGPDPSDRPPPEPPEDDPDDGDPENDPEPGDGAPCSDGEACTDDPNRPEDDEDDDPCDEVKSGSIIYCTSRSLGEQLAVAGTDLTLNYHSRRVPARSLVGVSGVKTRVRMTEPELPAGLVSARLRIFALGQRYEFTAPLVANHIQSVDLQLRDTYNRAWRGVLKPQFELEYRYPTRFSNFFGTSSKFVAAWERFGTPGLTLTGDLPTRHYTVTRTWESAARSLTTVGRLLPGFWDARGQGFGGWTLNDHHVFDPQSNRMYIGTGQRIRVGALGSVDPPVANLLLKNVSPDAFPGGRRLAAAPDGAVFVLAGVPSNDESIEAVLGRETGAHVLWRFGADGSSESWADFCKFPEQNDCMDPQGQPVAELARDVAVDAHGLVFVTDGRRVYRFESANAPEIIADATGFPRSCELRRLVARQQRIYFTCAAADGGWVGALWPDGSVARIAGGGSSATDGVAAEQLSLVDPTELAVDFSGNIFVYDESSLTLWRVRANGVVESVLGNGTPAFAGDQSLAKGAPVGVITSMVATADDRIVYAEQQSHRIREVRPDGRIYTIAGGGAEPVASLGRTSAIARQLQVDANDVDILPEGTVAHLYSSQRNAPSYLGAVLNSSFATFRGYGGESERFRLPSRDGTEVYVFDSRGRHLETLNGVTRAVQKRFVYNSAGYITGIEDGDGNLVSVERNGDNRPAAIVNPDGVRTELEVSQAGYLTLVRTPTGDEWSMDYFPDGLLRWLEDPRGGRSEFTWSPDGRLSRDQNAAGGFVSLARTSLASIGQEVVTTTTAEARIDTYVKNRHTAGGLGRNAFRADETQSSRAMALGGVEVVRQDHGIEVRTRSASDPRFTTAPVFYPDRVVTSMDGMVQRITRSRNASESSSGSPGEMNLDQSETVNDRTYQRNYDATTRTWTTQSPTGRTSSIQIDEQGRPLTVAIPGLATVEYQYDNRGRLQEVGVGSGTDRRVTTIGYDARGYVGSIRNAELRTVTLINDASGRTTTQLLPDDREIEFRFDRTGNVVGITPPGRGEHGFDYNAVQLMTRYSPPALPAGGAANTDFDYNLDKQLTNIDRPDGDSIELNYGLSTGLLHSITGALRSTELAIDGHGRITRATPADSWETTWDWAGMLPKLQSVVVEASAGSVSRHVRWGYDNNFWLRTVEIANEAEAGTVSSTAYTYDDDGLLTMAATGLAALTLTRSTDNGLLIGTDIGLLSDAWTHNDFAEPIGYAVTVSAQEIFSIGVTRDKLGRITRKVENVGGVTEVFDYRYDLASRLDTVHRNSVLMSDYGFDANSNRTSATHMAPLTGQTAECAPTPIDGTVSIAGVVDAQDRLTSYGTCTFAYTRNGELTTKIDSATGATTTYVYDEFGNLRTVDLPDGRGLEYVADGLNRRVGKQVNGVLTQGFLYGNQLEPIAELDGSGNVVATFVYADRTYTPAYMLKGGRFYRILSDYVGSVRLVVDAQSGSVAQRMDYDDFGNVIADSAPGFQPFGFAGGIYDRDTGLVRFGARDYDPVIGRWTAKDPIGFGAIDTNLYRYTYGDPINLIDPSGLQSVTTDMQAGTTTFDPAPYPGTPVTIDTSNAVTRNAQAGAADPYTSPDVNWIAEGTNSRAYGPDGAYIDTGDRRGRDIHGGGSALPRPFDARQGWTPTLGCTRGQNEDITQLGRAIDAFKRANPGVQVPYIRQ